MTAQLSEIFSKGKEVPSSLSTKITKTVSEVTSHVTIQVDNALKELGKENVKLTPDLSETVSGALDDAFKQVTGLLPMLHLLEEEGQAAKSSAKLVETVSGGLSDLLTNVDRLFVGTMDTVSKAIMEKSNFF